MQFPSSIVRALIKEQEDVEHLKESAANQTRDIHIQSTHGSSHGEKVDSSMHALGETCHQTVHQTRLQPLIKKAK